MDNVARCMLPHFDRLPRCNGLPAPTPIKTREQQEK
jgi:hypothetical protein